MRTNKIIKTNKHFNYFLLLLSVIITVILTVNYFNIFYSYEFTSINRNNNNIFSEVKIIECENNSLKYIRIMKQSNQDNFYSFFIYNDDLVVEEQYNIRAENLWIKDISTFDFNNDSVNEFILLYTRNDSLFVSVIDHNNNNKLIDDNLILTRNRERYAEKWDLVLYNVGIKKIDNEINLFFAINAAYSINPRGVYIYNFNSKSLTKYEFGASIFGLVFLEDKEVTNTKILCYTVASGNTAKLNPKPEFDDFSSWVFIFDLNLNLLNKYENKGKYSGFKWLKIYEKEKIFITKKINNENNEYKLLKFSFNGELLDSNKIDHYSHVDFVDNENLSDEFTILINDSISFYNSNIENTKLINKKNSINGLIYLVDIDNNGEIEYLNFDQENIKLFDKNFNELISLNRKSVYYNNYQPPTYKYHDGNKISIIENSFDFQYKFSIEHRSRLYLIPFFVLANLSTIFIVLLFIKYITIKSSIIFSYFINSTNRSFDSIIIVDNKKKLLYANKTARKKFNSDYNLWFGKKILNLLNTNEDIEKLINKTLKSKRYYIEDLSLLLNNKYFKFKCTSIPLTAPWNLTVAVYLKLEDISEEIYSEREKVLAHSTQKVAHEIKTPLASILLNLDSIEKNEKNINDSLLKDLNTARNEIYRIRDFINKYLKFTNSQDPSFQSIIAEDLINNALFRFSSYLERNIKIVVSGDLNKKIWCDSFQIEEVFQVLIENAIDSMEGKGNIYIRCKETLIKNINILEFQIADEGKGIDNKVISSIYDPYTTTKKHGTGMGLAIAKKILKDHKSELKIKSTNNSGTVFAFAIKIVE